MPYLDRDPDYREVLAEKSAMWADLYALTMAQTLWLEGRHNQETTFHAFIRKTPYDGAYLVTAGQNIVHEWLDKHWKFDDKAIRALAKKTVDGQPVFRPDFLEFLKNSKLEIDMEAMPEGEIAFPGEPIYKTRGPAWQNLVVEAAILNAMNSQSSFATYASMLKTLANGKPVAEFGLRRAQAIGGLEPTRGAYVGGASSSSNCWAEENYQIPTVGTMAHAYVMFHGDEAQAFGEWAKHNPYLGAFLVDTYETKEGVKKAIEACKKAGIKLSGIRLDSGDLAYLSKEARKLMDDAGFKDAKIVVSNDLDRETINALEQQNAPIDMYAVGTNLVTSKEQPALGGVYKIANVYDDALSHSEIEAMRKAVREGKTEPKEIRGRVRDLMKISEDPVKMTIPGEMDLVRYLEERDGQLYFDTGTILPALGPDVLTVKDPKNEFSGYLNRDIVSVRRDNPMITKTFNKGARAYRPLQTMFKRGKLVGNIETVHHARARAEQRLKMLDDTHKRYRKPHIHVVGVEEGLFKRQQAMAKHLRKHGDAVSANKLEP